jgi:hypothetical protein
MAHKCLCGTCGARDQPSHSFIAAQAGSMHMCTPDLRADIARPRKESQLCMRIINQPWLCAWPPTHLLEHRLRPSEANRGAPGPVNTVPFSHIDVSPLKEQTRALPPHPPPSPPLPPRVVELRPCVFRSDAYLPQSLNSTLVPCLYGTECERAASPVFSF